MRILFLRHGEPDYRTDSLTAKGRREADLLSRRLKHYRIEDFYTSPLGRARETAEYTLRLSNRKAEILPWLAEFRGHFQCPDTGREIPPWNLPPRFWTSWPELKDPAGWADSSLFTGGTVKQIWEETKEGMDELMSRYGFYKDGPVWRCNSNSRKAIAVFCHFGITMAALAYLLEESPLPLWHHIMCVPSSLTEVVTEERIPGEAAFRIIKLGDTTHLEASGEGRSTSGLFPECWTGVDTTDQTSNGETLWDAWNPVCKS